ncbi:uncharacterized protein F4807DRAFT_463242 [Annulohypoxylon truncatum]|uniref:uncharacterized protein n=1 Tax=Annulohypoxylon truncatum TaxID=327061 RepID=UPI002008A03F|nr:uncharacterized protein F4807DRAFT_463242 [Annulohypoxylon truncatum]KAI1206843.1 hypothetical protein F4807DRAFT_463242 [Annulohypoxylon truncatum]
MATTSVIKLIKHLTSLEVPLARPSSPPTHSPLPSSTGPTHAGPPDPAPSQVPTPTKYLTPAYTEGGLTSPQDDQHLDLEAGRGGEAGGSAPGGRRGRRDVPGGGEGAVVSARSRLYLECGLKLIFIVLCFLAIIIWVLIHHG